MTTDPNQAIQAAEQIAKTIDPTVYYYTFSTIAQTLGAAFGFLGAFMLFRIAQINQSIMGVCSEMRAEMPASLYNQADVIMAFYQEHWDSLYQFLKKYVIPKPEREHGQCEKYDKYFEQFENRIIEKLSLIHSLKCGLYLTILGIAYSIVCLSVTKYLTDGETHSGMPFLLFTAILITAVCLYQYARMITSNLK